MINTEVRQLYDSLTMTVNQSKVPIEVKRIILEDLAKQCEIKAIEAIQFENIPIVEKGELDGSAMD